MAGGRPVRPRDRPAARLAVLDHPQRGGRPDQSARGTSSGRGQSPTVVDLRESEGDPFDRALVAWQVEEALRKLGEDHRRVLVETYYRARPYAEVAAELGIPEGTVKSRVYYALRALRLTLEEMGWQA